MNTQQSTRHNQYDQNQYNQTGQQPTQQPATETAGTEADDTGDLRKELMQPHPTGAAAARKPPSVPLAPMKRMQARFNPLANGMIYLVVFLGGCVGTALRYGLWLVLPYPGSDSPLWMAFHPATFIANMIACFVFALLTSYMSQAIWIRKHVRQLASRGIGMGMCGGFSTLSAMMVEDITALHNSGYLSFIVYTVITFLVGIVVAWFGSWLGLKLTSVRAASLAVADALRHREQPKPAIGVRVPVEDAPLDAMPVGDPNPKTDEIPIVHADPLTGEVK